MTTPDQIDRAALTKWHDDCAAHQRKLADLWADHPLGAYHAKNAAKHEQTAELLRAAPTGGAVAPENYVCRRCGNAENVTQFQRGANLCDACNTAAVVMMDGKPACLNCGGDGTAPPAEEPVARDPDFYRYGFHTQLGGIHWKLNDEPHNGSTKPNIVQACYIAHPPAPRGVADGAMRQAADALRAVQSSRDATHALVRLVDPALVALTAALVDESGKPATGDGQ